MYSQQQAVQPTEIVQALYYIPESAVDRHVNVVTDILEREPDRDLPANASFYDDVSIKRQKLVNYLWTLKDREPLLEQTYQYFLWQLYFSDASQQRESSDALGKFTCIYKRYLPKLINHLCENLDPSAIYSTPLHWCFLKKQMHYLLSLQKDNVDKAGKSYYAYNKLSPTYRYLDRDYDFLLQDLKLYHIESFINIIFTEVLYPNTNIDTRVGSLNSLKHVVTFFPEYADNFSDLILSIFRKESLLHTELLSTAVEGLQVICSHLSPGRVATHLADLLNFIKSYWNNAAWSFVIGDMIDIFYDLHKADSSNWKNTVIVLDELLNNTNGVSNIGLTGINQALIKLKKLGRQSSSLQQHLLADPDCAMQTIAQYSDPSISATESLFRELYVNACHSINVKHIQSLNNFVSNNQDYALLVVPMYLKKIIGYFNRGLPQYPNEEFDPFYYGQSIITTVVEKNQKVGRGTLKSCDELRQSWHEILNFLKLYHNDLSDDNKKFLSFRLAEYIRYIFTGAVLFEYFYLFLLLFLEMNIFFEDKLQQQNTLIWQGSIATLETLACNSKDKQYLLDKILFIFTIIGQSRSTVLPQILNILYRIKGSLSNSHEGVQRAIHIISEKHSTYLAIQQKMILNLELEIFSNVNSLPPAKPILNQLVTIGRVHRAILPEVLNVLYKMLRLFPKAQQELIQTAIYEVTKN